MGRVDLTSSKGDGSAVGVDPPAGAAGSAVRAHENRPGGAWTVLVAAASRVPGGKWVFGPIALGAAATLVQGLFLGSARLALFGTTVAFIFCVLFYAFAKGTTGLKHLTGPLVLIVWALASLFILSLVTIYTSVFWAHPLDLRNWIALTPTPSLRPEAIAEALPTPGHYDCDIAGRRMTDCSILPQPAGPELYFRVPEDGEHGLKSVFVGPTMQSGHNCWTASISNTFSAGGREMHTTQGQIIACRPPESQDRPTSWTGEWKYGDATQPFRMTPSQPSAL